MDIAASLEKSRDSLNFSSDRETIDSSPYSPKNPFTKQTSILIPKCHMYMFTLPSDTCKESVQYLNRKLPRILEILEDAISLVNIRDEMSTQGKQVVLQLPFVRRTAKRLTL